MNAEQLGRRDYLTLIRDAFQEILRLPKEDVQAVDFVISLCLINTWGSEPDPVWGYLVGPPASAKTEILRTLGGWPHSYHVDELTENALASGYKDDKEPEVDNSTFAFLNGKVLVVKDFSSIAGQSAKNVNKVLGTLRAAYDGTYSKASGTGSRPMYVCKFGIIVATTATIDHFMSVSQQLGERFLLYRVARNPPVRRQERIMGVAQAREMMKDKNVWRASLKEKVQNLLSAARTTCLDMQPSSIEVPPEIGTTMDNISDLLCRIRTVPLFNQPTSPETGNRVVQQLINLMRARAILSGRDVVDGGDLSFIQRVALDTLPYHISILLQALYNEGNPQPVTSADMASHHQIEDETAYNMLKQYAHLGVVERIDEKHCIMSEDTTEQIHLSGLLTTKIPEEQRTQASDRPPDSIPAAGPAVVEVQNHPEPGA